VSTVRYYNPRMRRKILAGETPWWINQHPRRKYIIAANLAAPEWVNRAELEALRLEARRLTLETGVKHVVNHIVPLCHPYVCGLTVPWNLRVITYAQNAAKSNHWMPDQLALALG
jgi:hypothetical protein